MTGTFGGVIRDILCNEIPVIFRKEIYATACIFGGLVFVIMHDLGVKQDVIYLTTSLIVISIRLIVVKYHISLPYFYISSEKNNHVCLLKFNKALLMWKFLTKQSIKESSKKRSKKHN